MKRILLVAAFLVCALLVAGPASAVLIGADELVGTKDFAQPADISDELGYANTLITAYNAGGPAPAGYTLDPPLPTPPLPDATGGVKFATIPADTTSYSYLWAKFGNSGALYYIGDLGDTVTGFSSNPFGPTGSGLSHVTLFGPTQVPEGATLMLLGFGLAGVGTLRRFIKQ